MQDRLAGTRREEELDGVLRRFRGVLCHPDHVGAELDEALGVQRDGEGLLHEVDGAAHDVDDRFRGLADEVTLAAAGFVHGGGAVDGLGLVAQTQHQPDQRPAVGDAVLDATVHRRGATPVVLDDVHLPQRPLPVEQLRTLCRDQFCEFLLRARLEDEDLDVVGDVELGVVLPVRQVQRIAGGSQALAERGVLVDDAFLDDLCEEVWVDLAVEPHQR